MGGFSETPGSPRGPVGCNCGHRGPRVEAAPGAEGADGCRQEGGGEGDGEGCLVAVEECRGGGGVCGGGVHRGCGGEAEGRAELEGRVEEAARQALFRLVDALGRDDGERAVGQGEPEVGMIRLGSSSSPFTVSYAVAVAPVVLVGAVLVIVRQSPNA